MTENESTPKIGRRESVAVLVASGLGGRAFAAPAQVAEHDVEVKTPDGVCDAAFIYAEGGSHPGVLVWPDAFGLRPALRGIARRLAAEGYAVLVPNPFYRMGKAPFHEATHFDFKDPAQRAKIMPLMASVGAAGHAESDAAAYIAFLDAQSQVDRNRKVGTQGYCMGGPLVVRTSASQANRVGAGASFHGGGLVTEKPDSPHLLAPKIKASMYFGIAASDDAKQPDAKEKLKEAFAGAHVPAEVEVYEGTLHGWCIPDMPQDDGKPIYNQAQADRAWAKLLALYKASLV